MDAYTIVLDAMNIYLSTEHTSLPQIPWRSGWKGSTWRSV